MNWGGKKYSGRVTDISQVLEWLWKYLNFHHFHRPFFLPPKIKVHAAS